MQLDDGGKDSMAPAWGSYTPATIVHVGSPNLYGRGIGLGIGFLWVWGLRVSGQVCGGRDGHS